jgi:hypothetical protein
MEERGVSKLVGMKLTPATRASTNGATAPAEDVTQANFPMREETPRVSSAAAR